MAEMSAASIRQISNGWVVTFYLPGTVATATQAATQPTEYEQYYTDIASATAGIAVVL